MTDEVDVIGRYCARVGVDLEHALGRVAGETFGDEFEWSYIIGSEPTVEVRTSTRRARLGTTGEVFVLSLPDLGVSTALIEYDLDQTATEELLRVLAMVARVFLHGGGVVEHRRGLFRRQPRVTIECEGRQWRLGRSVSTIPYP